MTPLQPGKQPMEPSTPETISILHELDLGQHTLFIMSNGGIDLLAHDEQTSCLADNRLSLDGHEAYRLFISLQELFHSSCGFIL
jgi:hypothetical protein